MPWTKSFDWRFFLLSSLALNAIRINLCSRSWGHIEKVRKDEITTHGKRKKKKSGGRQKDVFAFLGKQSKPAESSTFFSPLPEQGPAAWVVKSGEQRVEGGVCRQHRKACEVQIPQSCARHPKQLVSGLWSSEIWVLPTLARLLIRIQFHCTWWRAPRKDTGKSLVNSLQLLPKCKPGWPEGWLRQSAKVEAVLSLKPWIKQQERWKCSWHLDKKRK